MLVAVNFGETMLSCLIGIATVFVGLICIILICKIMGAVCSALIKEKPLTQAVSPAQGSGDIPNKQEFIAAVSAAIAEDMGTDIGGIRILSVKKL
ncbi:MAG: hypothetical protein E7389_08645 [Ruminococcaceae bacterium]|jgi:Na+-transporting methylmalonyl-CoA/oxaloacetate decarboxylase gamma subunit|nr:hypothetical protein [Oscillospiraceae bacterium]